MVSDGAGDIVRRAVLANPALIGKTRAFWVPASDNIDMLGKGHIDVRVPEADRKVDDKQLAWYRALERDKSVRTVFNAAFFVNTDSREPEQAGIWGSVVGSFFTMLVTLLLAFPLGVATAIYLEEFAPTNRWTDLIEVNINNLAAVPSIVFGLLGLSIFLGFFGMPRSAPLVGGMVLALMTLPTVIISARAAIESGAAFDPRGRPTAIGASRFAGRGSSRPCRWPCPAS